MKQIFNRKGFSEAVKFQRNVFEIGMRKAAEQIGTSASTLSRCENGKMPDVITYANICKWLDCSLDTFILNKKSKSITQ